MKTTVLAWVAGLGLALGCATPAGQGSAGAGTEAKEAEAGLICENQRVTGSHMTQRVCRKASTVEQEREKTQRELQGVDRTNERFGQ